VDAIDEPDRKGKERLSPRSFANMAYHPTAAAAPGRLRSRLNVPSDIDAVGSRRVAECPLDGTIPCYAREVVEGSRGVLGAAIDRMLQS
jgi:hypothetical protein